jgi:hypothetical protein
MLVRPLKFLKLDDWAVDILLKFESTGMVNENELKHMQHLTSEKYTNLHDVTKQVYREMFLRKMIEGIK